MVRFFGIFFLSPEYVVAREGPVFEGRERKVRLAAFTVHIKPCLSAHGRVPFALVPTQREFSTRRIRCSRGGRGIVEDMCYERRRAEACVD